MDEIRPVGAAFDVGGTFTDVVVIGGFGVRTFKIPSLSDASELGASVQQLIEAAREDDDGRADMRRVAYGTTVASNAVLEGTGSRVGVLTTEGFRDELEIRRTARPGVWDPLWQRTPPLVARRLRVEVGERVAATGGVERTPDAAAVREALEKLREHGAESLAICFINAYANGENEELVARIALDILPGMHVSVSSEVLPEPREYERASTTALNAYLAPLVERHLSRLEIALDRLGVPITVMQSNGGLMTTSHAKARPISLIESGPAAGAVGAARLAADLGEDRCIAFDMGGTTAKVCLIEGGNPVERPELEVGGGTNAGNDASSGGGYVLRVPTFDLVEIGAGGGSIAWSDASGTLRVGPRSAGAVPGPASYGTGGTQPTVTDANVVLGRLSPVAIAGGTIPISQDLASHAFEGLSRDIGRPIEEVALGVVAIVNASMTRAIRSITTERGRDPREYALMAFGGAGPLHACDLADRLGVAHVIAPPHAGVFSAIGMLITEVRHDFVRSVLLGGEAEDTGRLLSDLVDLESEALGSLKAVYGQTNTFAVERRADVRYSTQHSALTVVIPPSLHETSGTSVREVFEAEHQLRYGYIRSSDTVSVDAVRLRITVVDDSRPGALEFGRALLGSTDAKASERGRAVRLNSGEATWTPIMSRGALVGTTRTGPLIIEEDDTTTLVPSGWTAECDSNGVMHLRKETS